MEIITKYVTCPCCGSVEFELDYEDKESVYCIECDHDFKYPKSVYVDGRDKPFQLLCGKFQYCEDCSMLVSCWGCFPVEKKNSYYNYVSIGSVALLSDTVNKKIQDDYLHLEKLTTEEWKNFCFRLW